MTDTVYFLEVIKTFKGHAPGAKLEILDCFAVQEGIRLGKVRVIGRKVRETPAVRHKERARAAMSDFLTR